MAGRAVLAELAVVRVVLHVAGDAVGGRRLQIGRGAGIGVAAGAGRLQVPAGQRKDLAVVEVGLAVAVDAVVAVEARRPEVGHVRLHVGRVEGAVAVLAGHNGEARQALRVAVAAREWAAIGPQAMSGQRIAHPVVGEAVHVGRCQVGSGAAVLAVALAAVHVRSFALKRAVQRGGIGQVVGDGDVAVQAALGHGRDIPGRGVAGCAVAAGLCVREDSAQLDAAGLGVQRAGAPHAPAAQHKDAQHQQQSEGDGQQAGGRETAETT